MKKFLVNTIGKYPRTCFYILAAILTSILFVLINVEYSKDLAIVILYFVLCYLLVVIFQYFEDEYSKQESYKTHCIMNGEKIKTNSKRCKKWKLN